MAAFAFIVLMAQMTATIKCNVALTDGIQGPVCKIQVKGIYWQKLKIK